MLANVVAGTQAPSLPLLGFLFGELSPSQEMWSEKLVVQEGWQ